MVTLKVVLLIAAFMGSVGLTFGYVLRILVALGKKGSIELDIKQMMVNANEKAKQITLEAEERASETLKSSREEVKEREETIKKIEERLIKKEDFLDKRQTEIDKDVEDVKARIQEVKTIKEKVESMAEVTQKELERVANLSVTEAKGEMVKAIEKNAEGDLVVRMHKLEMFADEKLDGRAREILTSAVQRLASSVSADLFTTNVPPIDNFYLIIV